MSTMNLPSLKPFVGEQVYQRGTGSECVRELLRCDQDRRPVHFCLWQIEPLLR